MSRVLAFRSSLFLAVAGALCLPISVLGQELFSESVYVPPLVDNTPFAVTNLAGWNDLNILISGASGLPAQDATDTNTDPYAVNGTSTITVKTLFTPGASTAGDFLGPGPITLRDMTHVQFSGTTSIDEKNIPEQNVGNTGPYVQFGLTGPANNSVMNFVSQSWQGSGLRIIAASSTSAGYLHGAPIVSVTPHPAPPAAPPAGESFDYIIDYIHFNQMDYGNRSPLSPSGDPDAPVGTEISVSEWVEFPYLPGQQPTFTYSGWASVLDPIRFIDSEIQLSPTEIPLDDLNYADDPPREIDPTPVGGVPAFTTEANPDDIVTAVPEPGAMVMTFGAIFLLTGRKRLAGG